jgi:uncharacterized membrane protein YozB (DUF420 family)
LAYILITGALVWALSEVIELAQGGFTPLNSSVSALAFVLIGAGVWALWRRAGQSRPGQAGVAMLSVGMVLFAVTAIQVVMTGAANDTEISGTPLFLTAGSLVSLGTLLVGWWLITGSSLPKWIGAVLIAATLFTLAVAFVPAMVGLQPLSNLVLAAVLALLGWRLKEGQVSP